MVEIMVPIFVCVVLPVAIVALISARRMNSDNKRAKVLIKAIESNCNIDADKLAEALQKPQKTPRQLLNDRLLRGCIFGIFGLALIVTGIVSYCAGTPFFDEAVSVSLMFGGLSLAVGISYLIVYFVTRSQIKD